MSGHSPDPLTSAFRNLQVSAAPNNSVPSAVESTPPRTATSAPSVVPSPSQGQQQHEAQSAPSTPVQQQQTQTQLTPVTVVFHGDCARHSYKRGPTDPTVERPDRLAYVREGVEFLLGSPVPSPVPWRAIESARSVPLYDPVVLAAHSREFIDDLHKWTQESGPKLARKEVELPANLDADDLYLCPESITAMSGALGAAFDAVDNVCHPKAAAAAAAAGHEQRSAFAAIRPPGHHATCKDPSGFCYINNAVCAALYAHSAYRIQRVAIIDFDLHHGDGTQEIVRRLSHQQPTLGLKIFYGSLHDVLSFPTEIYNEQKVNEASMCIMAHDLYLWNIHLEPYKNLPEFEQLYQSKYLQLLRQAEKFLAGAKSPNDSLLIVSAGFDAHEKEYHHMQRHGRSVPDRFFHRFTEDLLALARSRCAGRMVSVLEGGYSREALAMGVSGHVGAMLGYTEQQSKFTSKARKHTPSVASATPPGSADAGVRTRHQVAKAAAVPQSPAAAAAAFPSTPTTPLQQHTSPTLLAGSVPSSPLPNGASLPNSPKAS